MTARTASSPALEGNNSRIVNYLPAALDTATALRQAILQALSWRDLEAVLEQVQATFEAGQIDQEQALGLAAIAAQEVHTLPEVAEEKGLSDLLRRQPVVRVYSRALGETVLWTADDAQVPADNRLAVYRAGELRQVAGRTPQEVQAIHAVKQALDGEIFEEGEADAAPGGV